MPSLHEVERSHDEWGNTPSLMPSLLPCEAAAYNNNTTTGTAITTVDGPPCDANDPIDIIHHNHRILLLYATRDIDGRYQCLAPTQFSLSLVERDVPASRYESEDLRGGGTKRVDGTLTKAIVFPSPPRSGEQKRVSSSVVMDLSSPQHHLLLLVLLPPSYLS
jgi:hypothetical protein